LNSRIDNSRRHKFNHVMQPKKMVVTKCDELKIRKNGIYFLPLGGTGEFGLNLNLYCCDGKWIIVDLGVSFDGTSSINVFMPKIDFIRSIPKEDLLGIFITHGHEDHLGAVQYLWKYIKKPVYASPFTVSLLKRKIKDMRGKHESDLHEVKQGDTVNVGPFSLQWAYVTHSIPDTSMLMIRTKYGNILHTGDWRFDDSPVVGDKSDIVLLEKFASEGVLAIVGDSTNAMVEGKFASENDVKNSLEGIISRIHKGRVVVVCFSTNLSRVDSCARIAQKTGRRVALVGRSLHRIKEVAIENGYLEGIPEFLTEDAAKNYDKNKLLIVCTGSQGEPNSGLRRFADNEHPKITLEAGDTVIISARMITGKEKDINDMLNKLSKRGIHTITTQQDADIHVSGHPPQDDLRRLYDMMDPKIVVPVHGEPRNLIAHRDFARSMKIESEYIDNGDFIYLGPGDFSKEDTVEFGQLGLDGKVLIPRDGRVLMERQWLMNGVIFISVLIHSEERFQKSIMMFGVCEPHETKFKMTVKEKVDYLIQNMSPIDRLDHKKLLSTIRSGLQNYIFMERGIDPKIFVSSFILNIDQATDIEEDENKVF
jgi:ribonuclease J